MKRAETRTEVFELGDDGIVRATVKPTDAHTIEDARENVQAGLDLVPGERILLLLDVRGARSISREARAFYAGPENAAAVRATALLIDSPLGVVIGNFLTRVNRPAFPFRLFRDEGEAVCWLRSMCSPSD